MAERADPSLWRRALSDTLAGRRGVAKSDAIWLPIAVAIAASGEREAAAAVPAALLLVLAAVGRTQGCTLANDLSDRSDDAAAGKSRWVQALPPPAGAAIAAAWLALGIAAVAIPSSARAALPACLASAALGVLYSLPPARFKARGVRTGSRAPFVWGVEPLSGLGRGGINPAFPPEPPAGRRFGRRPSGNGPSRPGMPARLGQRTISERIAKCPSSNPSPAPRSASG